MDPNEMIAQIMRQAGMVQGFGAGWQPAVTGPVDQESAGAIASLQSQLATAAQKLNGLPSLLEQTVTANARESISMIELAMTKAYKIAIMVRGDYDSRKPDEQATQDLILQTVTAFDEAHAKATEGVKRIDDIRNQVLAVQQGDIQSAKQKLDLSLNQNRARLDEMQNRMRDAEQRTREAQSNLERQVEIVSSLQSRLADAEQASMASDIGFSILTLGIGNLINGGPMADMGLRQDLDRARNDLNEAQRQMGMAQTQMMESQQQYSQFQAQTAQLQNMQGPLAALQSQATEMESRCRMLQAQFSTLETATARLSSTAKQMHADSFHKKDFVALLLELCDDALIDSRLTDEVSMVVDEVIKEYGGAVPGDIDQARGRVADKLKVLESVPSVAVRV